MQLGFDINRFEVTTEVFNGRNERLKPFVERLNNSRVSAGYKPYSAGFVATKMSHVATDELEYFYKKLDGSRNFCALWHYFCLPKKK